MEGALTTPPLEGGLQDCEGFESRLRAVPFLIAEHRAPASGCPLHSRAQCGAKDKASERAL